MTRLRQSKLLRLTHSDFEYHFFFLGSGVPQLYPSTRFVNRIFLEFLFSTSLFILSYFLYFMFEFRVSRPSLPVACLIRRMIGPVRAPPVVRLLRGPVTSGVQGLLEQTCDQSRSDGSYGLLGFSLE